MTKFTPHITPVYPPNNHLIFEEWFAQDYKGCKTDRELLPFLPTPYWVNNNYAQDAVAKQQAQDYIDSLPSDKKYFVICQYDDGCLIDWKGKDVLEFNMSKQNGVMLPLICQPHPYLFNTSKKIFASFVGSRTHPLRNEIEYLKNIDGYTISFEYGFIQDYCRVLNESMFSLCPRGYGLNSFRIAESIQYGAIPVFITTGEEFIIPFGIDFEEFGVLISEEDIPIIDEILKAITPEEVIKKQNKLPEIYKKYYSYEGCLSQIVKELEKEYRERVATY